METGRAAAEPQSTAHRATFIVRLVREARATAAWRGEVEYVQRGERRSAVGVWGALAHVADWLEAEGPVASDRERNGEG